MSDYDTKDQFIYDGHIDYDLLITSSMYWLVAKTLSEVASKGLPGEHYLYISFDTTDPEVLIPDSLRALHPQEMTIVLQNRFYDLVVQPHAFSVSLSFSRVLERLTIPFHALTRFYDPSCGFVLQLGSWEESAVQTTDMPEYASEQDQLEDRELEDKKTSISQENSPSTDDNATETTKNSDSNNVVMLDQFRK